LAGTRSVAAVAAGVSVVLACAFALLLATQRVTSSDLGYHLAYGEQFLATGGPVDTNEFIYTLPQTPSQREACPPGPGCWYDSLGRYRFANANWLSQAIIAILYRFGGMTAMSLLPTACMAAVLGIMIATCRRLRVSWVAIAAGVVLVTLGVSGRYAPRPEMIAYPLLVAQMCLLLAIESGGLLSMRSAVFLVGLQVILVNVHSYFLLGAGMTGAMLADQVLRAAWLRWRGQDRPALTAAAANAWRLGAVLAAQAGACLVNPWTWRLAVMPIQTALYLREHHVTATEFAGPRHPWSVIHEIVNTAGVLAMEGLTKASAQIVLVLLLAGVGCLVALGRRRWGLAAILAAMGAIALSMVRNVAPASVLIVPAALCAFRPAMARPSAGGSVAAHRRAAILAALGLSTLSLWWSWAVVTSRFHQAVGWADRFGIGPARRYLPLDAADWLNKHKPAGRMWTDFDQSSNLYYFTQPHRDVPILTNTWAYPPQVMLMVLNHLAGTPFDPLVREYSIEIVAMGRGVTNASLVRSLANDPRWTIVHLDAGSVIFLRNEGPNADLARRFAIPAPAGPSTSLRAGAEAAEIDAGSTGASPVVGDGSRGVSPVGR
jgi:hypothetical protein